MAKFKHARAVVKQKVKAAAIWTWLNMTDVGKATQAYIRGDGKFDLSLRVDDGSFQAKVGAIEDAGWRLVDRIDAEPVESEVTTSSHDGSKVIRTRTQHGHFYFVRSDLSHDE